MSRYDQIEYDYDLSSRAQTDWYVRGADPNWRDGRYRGERMRSRDEERAPYGRYRATHAEDLGGYGGYRGVHADPDFDPLGGAAGHSEGRVYAAGWTPEDRGYHTRRTRYDRDLRIEGAPRGYDHGFARGAHGARGEGRARPDRGWPRRELDASRELRYDDGFNRYGGYSSGGFGEGGSKV